MWSLPVKHGGLIIRCRDLCRYTVTGRSGVVKLLNGPIVSMLWPDSAPGIDDRRVALPPWPPPELCQGRQRCLDGGRGVSGLVGRCHRTPLLPAGVVQAGADQVHDAGLQRRGRDRLTSTVPGGIAINPRSWTSAGITASYRAYASRIGPRPRARSNALTATYAVASKTRWPASCHRTVCSWTRPPPPPTVKSCAGCATWPTYTFTARRARRHWRAR